MKMKILLISMVLALVFFSGCIEEEPEELGEEFLAFGGGWSWSDENGSISMQIGGDGTGRYNEISESGVDFECAAFFFVSSNELSVQCAMLPIVREFSIVEAPAVESSNPQIILVHPEMDEPITFTRSSG